MFRSVFAQLLTWVGLRHHPLDHVRLVLYTRQDCHLCEGALLQLQKAQEGYGFELAIVDVDSDAQLQEQYGTEVPVVTVNGKVRFRGQVNDVLLRRLLRSAATKRSG